MEQVLRGETAPGLVLRIAWEELAPSRPDRFRDGDRVLVALAPLPDWSLWRQRFPGGGVIGVAERGAAFLRDPDAASVALVGAYLMLSSDERSGAPGVAVRARMLAEGSPELGGEALRSLAAQEDLAPSLGSEAAEMLEAVLGDESRPLALRRDLLRLAAERRLLSLRGAVEALARPAGALEVEALETLGRWDGSLPEPRVRALLARAGEPVRAVAVRHAGEALASAELGALAREDADPTVRAEAVSALAARGGTEGLEAASTGLFDAEADVRRAAARGIAAAGEAGVVLLRRLALERSAPEAAAPVAALSLAGAAGRAALEEIAATHPDEEVRELARLALGRPRRAH